MAGQEVFARRELLRRDVEQLVALAARQLGHVLHREHQQLAALDVTATSASSPGTGAGGSTSAPSGTLSNVLPAFLRAQVSLRRTVKP